MKDENKIQPEYISLEASSSIELRLICIIINNPDISDVKVDRKFVL